MTSRTQPTAQAQADPISETLRLVNQVRAANGLPPYQYNATLATAAQIHANWMAATNTYSHTETNGSTPYSRAVGVGYPSTGYVSENIVGGTKLSPRQAVIWWENSPVHFAGMVSSNNVEAGVGFASSGDQNYYVLVMGRPPAPGQETALAPRAQEPQAQPLFITPVQLAPPRDDGSIVHIVQPGQALWTLAAYYDVDLAYLELINGLPDDPLLRTGQEILIRLAEGQAPPPTPTPPLNHTVQEGETLWYLTYKYNLEMETLLWLNGLTEDAVLQPGQLVKVRLAEGEAPPPTPTPRLQHIVRAGETAWTIAALHGLTLGQLYALNGLTTDPVLHPGDLLWIREPLPTATPPYPPTFTPAPTRTPAAELTPPMPAFSPTPIPTITSAATATPLVLNTASSLPATPANNNLLLVAVGLLILGGFVMLVLRRA
ncbi:MAG: LysM peptidoglycan-binding domain-containing protein [Ardenticatenales bacterium]|nr:LysM peptidoglycan-binding domain-containing protein [Ardenticatenales bacterium]